MKQYSSKLKANFLNNTVCHPISTWIYNIKTTLSISLLILMYLNSYSQFGSPEYKFFNNDSIQYDIIYVSPDNISKGGNHISTRYIRLQMTKSFKNYLLKMDTSFWLEHLQNEKTDWATNLVLYYLYKRDASLIVVFNKRKKWLEIKEEEIRYWEKAISKNHTK